MKIIDKTNLINLETLFDGTNNFIIPDYQRGYAWTNRERQDLWEDIGLLGNDETHYTDMLSFRKATEGYEIVDGQQRITTLILLIVCIYKNLDSELSYEVERKYIKNERFDYRLKYGSAANASNSTLKFLMGDTSQQDEPGLYNRNLKDAMAFFKNATNGYSCEEYLALFKKVTKQLVFHIYDIADFDPRVVFETKNNRGKVLTTLEKLKNRLMYLSSKFVSQNNSIKLKQQIDEAWNTVYKRLGENEQRELFDDEFLKAHWMIYFSLDKKKGNTFVDSLLHDEFKPQKFNDSNHEYNEDKIYNYIDSIKLTSKYWAEFHAVEKKTDISICLGKFNRLGINLYAKVFVLSLLFAKGEYNANILNILISFERFYFVRKSIGNYTNDLSALVTVAKTLFDIKNHVLGRTIDDFAAITKAQKIIDDLDNEFNGKASDSGYLNENGLTTENLKQDIEVFKNKMKSYFDCNNGYYSWSGIRYFLYEYNEYLVESRGRRRGEPLIWRFGDEIQSDENADKRVNNLSIEHILPQKYYKVEYWNECLRGYDNNAKSTLVNMLGNLLPLAQRINSQYQNDCYPLKKNVLEINGVIHKTGYCVGSMAELVVSQDYPDHWTAKDISDRSVIMLEWLSEKWKLNLQEADIEYLKFFNAPFSNVDLEKLSQLAQLDRTKAEAKYSATAKKTTKTSRMPLSAEEFWSYKSSEATSGLAKQIMDRMEEFLKQKGYAFENHYKHGYAGFKLEKGMIKAMTLFATIDCRKNSVVIGTLREEDKNWKWFELDKIDDKIEEVLLRLDEAYNAMLKKRSK